MLRTGINGGQRNLCSKYSIPVASLMKNRRQKIYTFVNLQSTCTFDASSVRLPFGSLRLTSPGPESATLAPSRDSAAAEDKEKAPPTASSRFLRTSTRQTNHTSSHAHEVQGIPWALIHLGHSKASPHGRKRGKQAVLRECEISRLNREGSDGYNHLSPHCLPHDGFPCFGRSVRARRQLLLVVLQHEILM